MSEEKSKKGHDLVTKLCVLLDGVEEMATAMGQSVSPEQVVLASTFYDRDHPELSELTLTYGEVDELRELALACLNARQVLGIGATDE